MPGDQSGEIRGYELTPFTMHIGASPVPASDVLPVEPCDVETMQMPKELRIVGLRAGPTSPADAERQANELLDEYRRRLDGGDRSAVAMLLDINPVFMGVPWVREAYGRLAVEGRLPRKRGRPIGRDDVNPLVIIGLVEYLIETRRVANKEQAFGQLEASGLMSYAAAKDSFYRGCREERFRPVLLTFPHLSQFVSVEAGERLLRRVEMIEPGRTVTRTLDDPQRGPVELEIRG
jgi:hypothetical protein